MLRTVVAIEQDGLDVRVLTVQFDVPNKDFNLEKAIRQAASDYCQTKEGKQVYDYNCSCFNLADFVAFVPAEICQKYGFQKIDSAMNDLIVDWDETLVDEDSFVFRGNSVSFGWHWSDEDTFGLDFGDGEFVDSQGQDYFIHFEYHVKDNIWVIEVWWEDEALPIGFSDSEKYITEKEIDDVKAIATEIMRKSSGANPILF